MGKTYMFVLIAVYSVLMNIFVLKQFNLFGLATAGGNALYGAVFLLTDMISEHYSKKDALQSIRMGFFVLILFVIATQVLLAYVPNEFDFAQDSMQTLFTVLPRVLIGSLCAYFISQHIDIFLYEKIRTWTKGKYLFLRNNGSTLVSQFVDTIVMTAVGMTSFAFLPFEGIIPVEAFWDIVIVAYVIKVIVALIDTPFLYLTYKIKPLDKNPGTSEK